MRKEILKKSLKKIVSLLLVLTLIFGTGYSSYAQNTSIHLKLGSYTQLNAFNAYVYIAGHHGSHQVGVNEHVMVSSETAPPNPGDAAASLVAATKVKMTINGGKNQYSTTDFSLGVNSKILYFTFNNFKYYIGYQITNVGQEGGSSDVTPGGTMNYKVTGLPSFVVSYDVNTGTGLVPASPTLYQAGTTVNILGNINNITKSDHIFTGWNTAANGSGTSYVAGNSFVMGFADVTLYAQWAPLYNVYYDGNGSDGGTAPTDTKEYKPGDTATVATKGTLTKTNYTFAGWSTTADGNGTDYMPSSQLTIANADVTLYAQWTKIPTYNVTYDKNADDAVGDVPVDRTNYHSGDSVTVLATDIINPVLTRPEIDFIGWSTSKDGSSGILGASFNIGSSDVTLYAQWEPIDPVETHTITYHGNTATSGSVPVDGGQYLTGSQADVLGNTGDLALGGHIFNAWNTSADGTGISYAVGSKITFGTKNITLYAQWTPFYHVSYNGNGNTVGIAPTDATKYFSGDEAIVKPNIDLLKTHYTFGGWNTKADGNGINYKVESAIEVTADITLYAKWIPDPTYNVIYNTNGATSGSVPVDPAEYFTGDKPVVLGNSGSLALPGYDFKGWNTAGSGSGTAYNVSNLLTMASSDIILYAQWSLTPPQPPQGTTGVPTTSTPTTDEPETQPPTASTTASTEESTEELTEELIPEGAAIIVNFDEPLDSSTFEEVVELGTEAIPLAPALPQTGQLPVELFYGIGGLITAAGVFLRKNK